MIAVQTANLEPVLLWNLYHDSGKLRLATCDDVDVLPTNWRVIDELALDTHDFAIAFDGSWGYNHRARRWRFESEGMPFIAYVLDGILYLLRYGEAPFTLATGVSKVAMLRGWLPINGDYTNDHGLIVAYIKSGVMCYRNYCFQVDGTKLWEVEREVASFTGAVDSIALARLNDYRAAFLAEVAGEIHAAITARNWAGMSVPYEFISCGIQELTFDVLPLQYVDAAHVEYITAGISDIHFMQCVPIYPEVLNISNISLNNYSIRIKISHALSQDLVGLQTYFKVTDALAAEYAVLSTSAGADQTELMLHLGNFSSAENPLTVWFAYEDLPNPLSANNDGCEFELPAFMQEFTALILPPKRYTDEQITASIANVTFEPKQVYYRTMHTDEQITAGISNVSFVVTNVSGNPL